VKLDLATFQLFLESCDGVIEFGRAVVDRGVGEWEVALILHDHAADLCSRRFRISSGDAYSACKPAKSKQTETLHVEFKNINRVANTLSDPI
jgi:hypothetical protein